VPVRKQSLDTAISLDQTAVSGGISSSDVLKNTPNQGDTHYSTCPKHIQRHPNVSCLKVPILSLIRSLYPSKLEILHQLLLVHLSRNFRINMDRHIHTRRRVRRERMLVLRSSSRFHFCGRLVLVIVRCLSCCCSCRRSRSIILRRDETGLACIDCACRGVGHCAAVPGGLVG
jgi:hypothetical protein